VWGDDVAGNVGFTRPDPQDVLLVAHADAAVYAGDIGHHAVARHQRVSGSQGPELIPILLTLMICTGRCEQTYRLS